MSKTISHRHFLALVVAIIILFTLTLSFIIYASLTGPLGNSLRPGTPHPAITVTSTPHIIEASNFDGVEKHVAIVGNYLQKKFDVPIVYGGGKRENNPNSDHPKGLALDFMVTDREMGNKLNKLILKHRKDWNVTYTLWWVKDHYNHVHVSFKSTEDAHSPKKINREDWV